MNRDNVGSMSNGHILYEQFSAFQSVEIHHYYAVSGNVRNANHDYINE